MDAQAMRNKNCTCVCAQHATNTGCLECWAKHISSDSCQVCAQVVRDTGRNPSDGAWYLMLVFKNSGALHGDDHLTTADVEAIDVPQFSFGPAKEESVDR